MLQNRPHRALDIIGGTDERLLSTCMRAMLHDNIQTLSNSTNMSIIFPLCLSPSPPLLFIAILPSLSPSCHVLERLQGAFSLCARRGETFEEGYRTLCLSLWVSPLHTAAKRRKGGEGEEVAVVWEKCQIHLRSRRRRRRRVRPVLVLVLVRVGERPAQRQVRRHGGMAL